MIDEEKKGKRKMKYKLEGFMELKHIDPLKVRLDAAKRLSIQKKPALSAPAEQSVSKPNLSLDNEEQTKKISVRFKDEPTLAYKSEAQLTPGLTDPTSSLQSKSAMKTSSKPKQRFPSESTTSECLNQIYGKTNLRKDQGKKFVCFAVSERPDPYELDAGQTSKKGLVKISNFMSCISGIGSNAEKLVHLAKSFTLKNVYHIFGSVASRDQAADAIKVYFDRLYCECIDSPMDILYSGVSVCLTFLLEGKLFYGNVGNNSLLLLSEDAGEPVAEKMEHLRHVISNHIELNRLRNKHKEIKIEAGNKFRIQSHKNNINTVLFETTRCIGMMAGYNFGVIEKPGSFT